MSGDVDLIGASIVDDLGQYKYVEKSEQLGDLLPATLEVRGSIPGWGTQNFGSSVKSQLDVIWMRD